MKLCKDCENYRGGLGRHMCLTEEVSIVTGERRVDYCTVERIKVRDKHCGPEAKRFVQKKEQPVLWYQFWRKNEAV